MKNKISGIYAIFRKCDDKCVYIGQSTDCKARIRQHLNGTTNTQIENPNDYYTDIIEKHGFDSKEFRLSREAFWINVFEPEWNICRNRTSWNKGKTGIYSEETIHKMSESHLGKTHSEESNRKNREAHLGENNPMYGKPHSEETKQKIREAHLGKQHNMTKKHWKLVNGKRVYY